MDLASLGMLWMFGSAAIGGLVGIGIGRLSRFEYGLAAGLLVFGGVTLSFAARSYIEYRGFAGAGADIVWGEVVAIVLKPANDSGSVSSPAPRVRFTAHDGVERTIEGPTASAVRVGSHIAVIVDHEDPERSRMAQPDQLRGAIIGFLLLGSFPASFGLFMLIGARAKAYRTDATASGSPNRGRREPTPPRTQRSTPHETVPPRRHRLAGALLGCGLFASILWIGLGDEVTMERFSQGFGGVGAVLVCYAAWAALAARRTSTQCLGIGTLAFNFGLWSFVLHQLR